RSFGLLFWRSKISAEWWAAPPPPAARRRPPPPRRFQRLRHEPIGAHAADLARADQAALFENVEMLRERWERHVEGARQLAHGGGAGAEPAQHGAPRGIAQRAEDPGEMHLLCRHRPNQSASRYLEQISLGMNRRDSQALVNERVCLP